MSTAALSKEQKKNILIIEDEGDVCFLLNVILKEKDIDLEHVNTLSQAKVFLSEKVPSLVFLDNSLPDGRGTDFIEYIKSNYPLVKIIMITAYHSAAERERAIKHGADMFLEKPFTKEQLYKSIKGVLN